MGWDAESVDRRQNERISALEAEVENLWTELGSVLQVLSDYENLGNRLKALEAKMAGVVFVGDRMDGV